MTYVTKSIVHRIHVNKQKGYWTVHNSKGCFHFPVVYITTSTTHTEHKPEKKDNPRFFIKCKGVLWIDDEGNGVIK